VRIATYFDKQGYPEYPEQHRPSGVGEDRNACLVSTTGTGSGASSTDPPGSVRIATFG